MVLAYPMLKQVLLTSLSQQNGSLTTSTRFQRQTTVSRFIQVAQKPNPEQTSKKKKKMNPKVFMNQVGNKGRAN